MKKIAKSGGIASKVKSALSRRKLVVSVKLCK